MQNIRPYQGFTLPEILVMLTIVTILALISIPLMTNVIQNQRLVGTANNLYAYLQNARSEAIKRNANVYVSFINGDNWCYGMNAGSACDCSIANSCGLGTVNTPKTQQISLATSGLSGNALYFESTHGAANAAGSVTLTTYGQSNLITITIGRLGGLQICSTGISGYTAC